MLLLVSCHFETVRRLATISIIAAVVLAAVCVIWSPRRSSFKPEFAPFAGYTNGTIGAIAPLFATLSATESATIKRWLAAGTNAAMFTISNQQTCSIWVLPFVNIYGGAPQTCTETVPLLDAPSFSGIKLAPRQIATVQVAMVDSNALWRAEFEYTRDSCSDSLANGLRMLPEELRAWATRTPVQLEPHIIESESVRRFR